MEHYNESFERAATYRPSMPPAHGAGAFKDAARIIEMMEVQMKALESDLEWSRREIARLHEELSEMNKPNLGRCD